MAGLVPAMTIVGGRVSVNPCTGARMTLCGLIAHHGDEAIRPWTDAYNLTPPPA
jgi:hypothetical protein